MLMLALCKRCLATYGSFGWRKGNRDYIMQVPTSKTKWECSLSWPKGLLWPQFSSFVLIYWQAGWHMTWLDFGASLLLLWPVQNLREEMTPSKWSAKPYHLSHLHPIQNGPIVVSAAPYSHLLSAFPVACFLCNTQALSKSLKSGAEEHLHDHKGLLLISPIGSSIQWFPLLCFCRHPSLVLRQ